MRIVSWIPIAVAVALALTAPLSAQAQTLRCPSFEAEIDCLVEVLGLGEGSVVADIGAGGGEHAIALAERVGEAGRVYATEIEAEKRTAIAVAATAAGRRNVVTKEAFVESTGLPDVCCDAIYLRGVYHHLTRPEPFLESLVRTLRPGGRLVVIDFPPTIWLWLWRPVGVPENRGGHGIPPAIAEQELRAAGLERVEFVERWSGRWPARQYALVYRKPGR